jgi:hypothetical protein
MVDSLFGMSEATPMPIEPPTPSAEQLPSGEPWSSASARVIAPGWWPGMNRGCRPGATYQVLVTQRVCQRLRDAPTTLVGHVAGIVAVLWVDPTEASMIFCRRGLGDGSGR